MNPLVTVGIPVYNADSFVFYSIKSVLEQTYHNFELIIINDGSTDDSLKVIELFKDGRIKLINDGENRGLIYRLNQMVDLASGTYFVRMDADDIMFPNRIEVELQYLLENQNIDLVCSAAISIDKDNNILGFKGNSTPIKHKEDILKGISPIHPTVMAKISFFKKNPYREGFIQMEDMELWYRSVEEFNFFNIDLPLLFYREDSINISNKHLKMVRGKMKFAKTYKYPFYKTALLASISVFKFAVYKIFEAINMEKVILKRRYEALNDADKNCYANLLYSIVNAK